MGVCVYGARFAMVDLLFSHHFVWWYSCVVQAVFLAHRVPGTPTLLSEQITALQSGVIRLHGHTFHGYITTLCPSSVSRCSLDVKDLTNI